MIGSEAHAISGLVDFVTDSPDALLQLLVAAADKATYGRIIDCPNFPVAGLTSDLPAALGLLREVLESRERSPSAVLARLYSAARSLEHRKQTGQFFTPPEVAAWGLSLISPRSTDAIWDAGAGTGILGEAVFREGNCKSYIGIENDPMLALSAAHALEALGAPETFRIWYANFLALPYSNIASSEVTSPTVILSNPPFVRFHHLEGRGRLLGEFGSSLGVRLSSLSGSSNYFLCKAAELLAANEGVEGRSDDRRMLFFFPSEAAGAAHSRELRNDLRVKQGWRSSKHLIPRQSLNGREFSSKTLALGFVFDRHERGGRVTDASSVESGVVGDLLIVKRGISTGRNAFFVLSDDRAGELEIPADLLTPVLPTRIPLRGCVFSRDEWEALRESGHPCWLLTIPASAEIHQLDPKVQSYLKEGLRRGLNSTATARRLRRWYSIPVPPRPPDLFVTYLFRGAPRFLLNEARVHHLTNILGASMRARGEGSLPPGVVEELNRSAAGWIDNEKAGREYRDGLRKIEPKELERLPIDRRSWVSRTDSRTLFD